MFLPACQTPIDRKCHAGNERRVIAQEKGDGLGHFIGPGQSVQGILLFHGIPRRIGMVPELLLQHRRFHVTGTDAVDPYLVRCRFQGQGLGEGHDGAFRRPVESAGDVALETGVAADGDDTARQA